ncbi:hypothetical protein [Segatella buccae]|uniref:hypothetical protein n=1 Tax=Segatella buccae TaxID=28126 RepID=UPI0027BA4D6E|nr:hypothetical protein [Segatella buccae]
MKTRQEVVLSFVKFNKFAKQLIYDICIMGNTKLSLYADELLNFEEWVDDVIVYANLNPDPIILDKIASLGSPEMLEKYLKDGKNSISENTYDALTKVVNAMNSLHQTCYDINQEAKGKFKYLVDEFANEEAASLFDRAVSAGYLTAEYQPKGDTDLQTLKVLAFAIGEALHLTMRHKWSHFEEQWSIPYSNKLSSLPMSERQIKRTEKIKKLYPVVDFSTLTKLKEERYFEATYGSRRVRELYQELYKHGYISSDTTVEDFLSIFNLGDSSTRKPIEWTKSQRHLSYFILNAFSKTNKGYWIKAQTCFTVNGRLPHKGSMVSGMTALQKRPDYGRFDVELKRIASKYNNG